MLRGSLYQLYIKARLVICIESLKKKDACSCMRTQYSTLRTQLYNSKFSDVLQVKKNKKDT